MYDIIIIGAGVSGAAISRELSKYKLKVLVLDKAPDVSDGTSKANSAIIHGGYNARKGSLKALMNSKSNPMYDKVCEELDVPFKRIGSYVLSFTEEERKTLNELYENGLENNIKGLSIHEREEILKREPNVSTEVVAGLFCSTAGIIGPWEFAIGLLENAVDNGVEVKLNTEVIDIKKTDYFEVITNNGVYESNIIINAAGVYADKINNMVNTPSFEINTYKGQYYLLDKVHDGFVNTVLFQCPTEKGKGVLILPTVHGNILVGPDSEYNMDREDVSTDIDNLNFIKNEIYKTSSDVPLYDVITTFAGLRAKPSTGDFVLGRTETEHFYNIAGIESPGLSSVLAIAEYIVDMINEDYKLERDPSFNPIRKAPTSFMNLSADEKNELIKKDDRYGKVICRCEYVTEGEIVESINRPLGATTVDGVKRRVRPGSGRCQGGFCAAKVIEILAREMNKDAMDIVKDKKNSKIIIGKTKEK